MRAHLSICALIFALTSSAQNLVPNPDFERFDTCPDQLGLMERADDWWSVLGNCEYFNACAPPIHVGVPFNWFGTQEALSGVGYAGLYCYTAGDGYPVDDTREYMGAELEAPLVVGQEYHLSLHASLVTYDYGDGVWFANATNGLGILLTTTPPVIGAPPGHAQLFSEAVITDSVGWHTVAGSFIADSAYQYITIGNFFSDDSTMVEVLFPGGLDWSYYFIDDVCVTVNPETCFGVSSTAEAEKDALHVFPDPFVDMITFTGLGNGPVKAELSELGGRVQARTTIVRAGGLTSWNVTGLASGPYLLTLYMPNGSRIARVLHHLAY